jgi:hypothetical protein
MVERTVSRLRSLVRDLRQQANQLSPIRGRCLFCRPLAGFLADLRGSVLTRGCLGSSAVLLYGPSDTTQFAVHACHGCADLVRDLFYVA